MGGSDSGQYMLASVHGGGQVWYSQNYGQTWAVSNTAGDYWHGAAVSGNGQYALACIGGGKIWRSSDYGQSFTVTTSITADWMDVGLDYSGQYAVASAYGAAPSGLF
jgi:hypothetical protein